MRCATRRRGPGLVRRDHHAPPREGVAVSSALGLLDGLHRLVEPDALGAGQRARVERSRLGRPQPDVIDKVAAVFESYWNSGDFVPYDREQFLARTASARTTAARRSSLSPIELRLEPFQERLLEQIALVPRARAPSQSPRLRDRHRQDGHGRARLRAAPRGAAARAAAVRRPSRRDPRRRASRRSATRCATTPSASCGSAASGRALRARLRVDPEPATPRDSPTSTRLTSTS